MGGENVFLGLKSQVTCRNAQKYLQLGMFPARCVSVYDFLWMLV
jgi:hypothetical protein